MKVSVIIACYRGAERLKKLLPSIFDPDVEIIVYDDGSPMPDATAIQLVVGEERAKRAATLTQAFCCLRNSENRGYARCVRDAVAMSTGDIILLLDDDTQIPDGFFQVLRGLMMSLDGVGVLAWRSYGKNPGQSQKQVHGMMQLATQLASYCYAFPRKVWDEIGGFDTRFRFYCIDSDFALRAMQAGHPCYRVWWPLVPHDEHGGSTDTVTFSRSEVGQKDTTLFVEKWGAAGDEMEKRALKALLEMAE